MTDADRIVHYIEPITGPGFDKWRQRPDGSSRALPNMSVLVGQVIPQKSVVVALADGKLVADISQYYLYQRADIYLKGEVKAGSKATLSNPAPGVATHLVLEENGTVVGILSARANVEKALELLP